MSKKKKNKNISHLIQVPFSFSLGKSILNNIKVYSDNELNEELFQMDYRKTRIVNPIFGFTIFVSILIFNLFLSLYVSHHQIQMSQNLVINWIIFLDILIFGFLFFYALYYTIIQFLANFIFRRYIAKGKMKYFLWTIENFYFDFLLQLIEYHGLTLLSYSIFLFSSFTIFDSFSAIFARFYELIFQLVIALLVVSILWFFIVVFISIMQGNLISQSL